MYTKPQEYTLTGIKSIFLHVCFITKIKAGLDIFGKSFAISFLEIKCDMRENEILIPKKLLFFTFCEMNSCRAFIFQE